MRQTFLNAIRANPDDDTTRLVYADWLDDEGDADRADFIRTQVRSGSLSESNPIRSALEDHARALLEAHERRWLGALPPGVIDWSYRGGLVDHLTFDHVSRLEGLEDFLPNEPVRELSIGFTGDLERLRRPAVAEHVRGLHFRARLDASSAGGLHRLVQSAALPNLTSLKLSGGFLNDDFAKELALAPGLESLTKLHLLDAALTDAGADRLIRSERLAGVRKLRLFGSRLSCGPRPALVAGGRAGRWLSLGWLGGPGPWPSNADIGRLGACPNLRKLKAHSLSVPWPAMQTALEEVSVTGDAPSLPSLAVSACLPRLRRLKVWLRAEAAQGAGGRGLRRVLEKLGAPALRLTTAGRGVAGGLLELMTAEADVLDRLGGLDLRGSYRRADVQALASCRRLTGLDELRLSAHAALSPGELGPLLLNPALARLVRLELHAHHGQALSVARALAEASHLTRLRELTLAFPDINSACASALHRWAGLRKLDLLDLSGSEIDEPALRRLVESPNLSPATRLRLRAPAVPPDLRDAFRERLGRRFCG